MIRSPALFVEISELNHFFNALRSAEIDSFLMNPNFTNCKNTQRSCYILRFCRYRMTKSTIDKVGINKEPYKQPPYAYDAVQITITPDERKYLMDMAVILSKIMVKETNTTLLPDKTLASLGKMALSFMTSIFCTKVLSQSEIAAHLPDKQALNEFIAFRRNYMNMPVDAQIADLKRVGIVK